MKAPNWEQFGRAVWEAVWRQMRTALAAMVWTCAELWAWEVQVFEAAHLGTGTRC